MSSKTTSGQPQAAAGDARHVCTKCGWSGPASELRVEGKLRFCPRCPYMTHELPKQADAAGDGISEAELAELERLEKAAKHTPIWKVDEQLRAGYSKLLAEVRRLRAIEAGAKAVTP